MNNEIKKPLISFILPNYNNQHVINLFFEKFVENNTYNNYEFIVVDDGSEDNGLDLLYEWRDSGEINNLIIIEEPHKGIINALNKALANAKGEFIIRMDGDATIETKSFVEKFLEFYYINPEKIGVLTSKVITDRGKLHAIGRDVISEKGLLDRGKVPNEIVGKRKWDYNTRESKYLEDMINVPSECDTALGVCTFFERETALKIGGFDPNYPLWIEDDDFYLSFRLHGKKCFYLPNIEVCHHFSLRGDRNPENWKKNQKFSSKILSFFYQKYKKNNNTYIKILRIPVVSITHKVNTKKIYVFRQMIVKTKCKLDWRSQILANNYKYWNDKWGFDLLNPDIEAVKEKYKGTEVIWNYDGKLKQIGADILYEYSVKKALI